MLKFATWVCNNLTKLLNQLRLMDGLCLLRDSETD
jgi:hypothetical protein